MACVLWLPLRGDLTNNGICSTIITEHNTTIDTTGIMGKCYAFNGNDSYIEIGGGQLTELYNCFKGQNQPFTICFWYYLDDTNRIVFFGDYGLSHALNINLECPASSTNLRFYWGDSSNDIVIPGDYIHQQSWAHVTLVYTGTELIGYRDGTQISTVVKTLPSKNKTEGSFQIGRDSRTGVTALNGKLCDFRIYDMALSQKEIHEIAQGLIMHFPLDNNGMGVYNLLPDLDKWTCEGGIIRTKMVNSGYYQIDASSKTNSTSWGIYYHMMAEPNTTYTFSCDIKSNTGQNVVHGIGISLNATKYDSWPRNVNTNSIMGQRLTYTVTTGTDKLFMRLYISTQTKEPGMGTDQIFFAARPKLEIGAQATPYSIQNIYVEDKLTVYDTSGFMNNGIMNIEQVVQGISPRYTAATIFNGTDNSIKIPFKDSINTTYSFSCWMYKTVIGSKNYQTILGGPSGYEFEARAGGGTDPVFCAWWGSKPQVPYNFNEWTFLTVTRDTSHLRIYKNGVLESETTSVGSIPAGDYFIGSWKTYTGQNFDGILSDFRIYATVLSDNDVMELYNTSMNIDSAGNISARILS